MLPLLRRTILASSLAFSIFAGALPVSAQGVANEAEIRARFAEAERIYAQGDFAGALAEFDRIYQLLEQNPRRFFVLYNIGRCQEQLFRYGDALTSYQRYLNEGGARTELAGDAFARIRALEARLATLVIRTNTQAEVWVDSRHVGSAPGNVRIDGGHHTVELRARGFAPARADVQIAARTQQVLTLELDRQSPGISPAFFISGAALTAISAAVGIGFGAAALVEQSSIQTRLGASDETTRFQVTRAQIDGMKERALLADVFYGAALVFGVASVVLLFVTDWGGGSSSASASQLRFTPFGSEHAAGLLLEGSL